jgi:hypothetical protein
MSKEDCIPSCSYPITKHILTVNLKIDYDPNWEPNIISKMPKQKQIPRSIKK